MVLSHSRRAGGDVEPDRGPAVWLGVTTKRSAGSPGVAAVNRIDNVQDGDRRGAGAWGVIHPSYRGLRAGGGLPRRRLRAGGAAGEGEGGGEGAADAVCGWTRPAGASTTASSSCRSGPIGRLERWRERAVCPVDGRVGGRRAGSDELERLAPLPLLPEPFDVVVTRPVSPRLHGALRGPRLHGAVRAGGPAGRGARLRRPGADPRRRPGGQGVPAADARAAADRPELLRRRGDGPGAAAAAAGPDGPPTPGDLLRCRSSAAAGSVRGVGGGGAMSSPKTTGRVDLDATGKRLEQLGSSTPPSSCRAGRRGGQGRAAGPRLPRPPARRGAHRREERRIRTSLRLSGLPTGPDLGQLRLLASSLASRRSRIETLATCQWIREHETVLIQGPPGVGKTHLAVALGVKAVENGFSVAFYRLDDLLHAMKQDADTPPRRLRQKKYLNAALLIVDEVGFQPMTRQEASLFFRLVSYRYQKGATLITTNKAVKDWPEILAGDEVMATALLDRLLHHCHVLNIKGRSYRLKELETMLK